VANLERCSFTGDFERWLKGASDVERLSLRELCEGNLGGGAFFLGDSGGGVKEGSGEGHLSP